MLRRVRVSDARIIYNISVPSKEQQAKSPDALVAGTEVRVTAEQDGNGEWHALVVEILKLGKAKPDARTTRT